MRRLLPIATALLFAACAEPPQPVQQFDGPTMGSTYEVKFVGDVPLAKVREVVEAELAATDAAFSQWREDSELQRFNRHAGTEPFAASDRFVRVLQLALEVAEATEGAFDPTVQPLSELYRRSKRDGGRLDEEALVAAHDRVLWRRVRIVGGKVQKARADVALDLDGIVAGACADAIAQQFDALGLRAYYLQITGEVLCRGEKAPGQPWVIGVVDPAADLQGGEAAVRVLPLRDRALCTSGDYRNAIVQDGQVLGHVFDPRTGRSASGQAVSVSVLANRAAVADALGTAFLVVGRAGAERLWPQLQGFGPLGALFLVPGPDGGLAAEEIAWPK